jgi:GT2 family glycosyltransferase
MITVIYSTHKDKEYNEKFKKHLISSSGLNDLEVFEFENFGQYSLSNRYNKGIEMSTNDIVVCCHNDIKLSKNWGKKLLSDYSNNPEFGIIGKAGSCYFPESGVYWERMQQTMVGQVYHHPDGQKKWLSKYSPRLPFLIPVITIDGLFISFNKTKIKHRFDETIGKFHFYDHLFCIPNYLDGVKIGVTSSFEITHQSVGKPNDEFWESKDRFLEKYGKNLPLDLKPESVYVPKIKEKTFKKLGKVAIIIPTKGKIEMLMNCINSFYEHCNSKLFDVFIADTGSTDEEKEQLKSEINNHTNIKLIEYDYYNFAKINNDVVKNHVSDDYEFLLFCNNDIKILNNVITGMLGVFNDYRGVGTVGCRLHFGDNTVQHDGVLIAFKQADKSIQVGHYNLRNYYNFNINTRSVFGNTGGLLMIRNVLFNKLGMFNESYISCFEDVDLNIENINNGYINYTNSNCVAYHYESSTRNEDPKNLEKLKYDYHNNLLPSIKNNIDKIKNNLIII